MNLCSLMYSQLPPWSTSCVICSFNQIKNVFLHKNTSICKDLVPTHAPVNTIQTCKFIKILWTTINFITKSFIFFFVWFKCRAANQLSFIDRLFHFLQKLGINQLRLNLIFFTFLYIFIIWIYNINFSRLNFCWCTCHPLWTLDNISIHSILHALNRPIDLHTIYIWYAFTSFDIIFDCTFCS